MISRFLLPAGIVTFASLVLFVSLTNASELSFNVKNLSAPLPEGPLAREQYFINYDLPSASSSSIPFSSQFHSAQDKFEMLTAFTPIARSQNLLDDANERLSRGEELIRKGKIDQGLVAIRKAQEYLKQSYEEIKDHDDYRSNQVVREIGMASLKHRERLESLMTVIPDEARVYVVESLDISKNIYDQTKLALMSVGEEPPFNPFDN